MLYFFFYHNVIEFFIVLKLLLNLHMELLIYCTSERCYFFLEKNKWLLPSWLLSVVDRSHILIYQSFELV